jgi:hypothetical protein
MGRNGRRSRTKSQETDALADKFEIIVDPNAAPTDWDAFFDALSAIVERRLARAGQQAGESCNNGETERSP